MGKKANKKKPMLDVIGVFFFVFFMAIVIVFSIVREDRNFNEIGKRFCESRNQTFNYAKGETIRCYTTDLDTGVRTRYEYWMDMEIAEQLYGEQVETAD